MLVLPVIDAFRGLMPVEGNVERDASGAPPHKFTPDRLYCWPRPSAIQRIDGDVVGIPELRVRLAYCLGSKAETRAPLGGKDREVSERLDAAVDSIMGALRANHRHQPLVGPELWWDCYLESVGYNAVRTFTVRAHFVDVVIRLNP